MNSPDPMANKRAFLMFVLGFLLLAPLYLGLVGLAWHWMVAMWR